MSERVMSPFEPGAYVYIGFRDEEMLGVLATIIDINFAGVIVSLDKDVQMKALEGVSFFPWANVLRMNIVSKPQ